MNSGSVWGRFHSATGVALHLFRRVAIGGWVAVCGKSAEVIDRIDGVPPHDHKVCNRCRKTLAKFGL